MQAYALISIIIRHERRTILGMCGRSDAQNNRICVTDAGLGQANKGDQNGGSARSYLARLITSSAFLPSGCHDRMACVARIFIQAT